MSKSIAGVILVGFVLLIAGAFSFLVFQDDRRATAVHELLQTAQSAFAEGDLEAASGHYEAVLEKDARNGEALFALFDIHAFFNTAEAKVLLDRVEPDPDNRQGLLYRKVRLALLESDTEAIEALSAELGRIEHPDREGMLALLLLELEQGKGEEASERLGRMNTLYPKDRHLGYITASLLQNQETVLLRIQSKDRYLDLLELEDEFSFKSAVALLQSTTLPLFNEDLEAVAEHLGKHFLMEAGFAKLDLELSRQVTGRLESIRPELAFRIAGQLVEREDAGQAEQVLWISAGQAAGAFDAVQAGVDSLMEAGPSETSDWILAIQQSVGMGQYDEALTHMANALVQDPQELLCLRTLQWLVTVHREGFDDPEIARLADWIRDHPQSDPAIYLRACDILLEVAPERAESVYADTIARLAGRENILLANWLNRHGQYDRVTESIDREDALSEVSIFTVYCDALVGEQRYEETLELIEQNQSLLESWQYDFFLARIYYLQRDLEAGSASLRKAMDQLPSGRRDPLFRFANLAREFGDTMLQTAAYEQAYRRGMIFPQQSALSYLQILLDSGSVEDCFRFASYCHNLQPDNPIYLNNLCYFRIISGEAIGTCIEEMRRLTGAYPDMEFFNLTLALGELIGGFPGQARETLDSIASETTRQEMRTRLISAIILAGTGSREDGSSLLDSVEVDRLLEPERALINRYFLDGNF